MNLSPCDLTSEQLALPFLLHAKSRLNGLQAIRTARGIDAIEPRLEQFGVALERFGRPALQARLVARETVHAQLEAGDSRRRAGGAVATRAATRVSAVLTPQRAVCGVVLASAACLAVAQFVTWWSP